MPTPNSTRIFAHLPTGGQVEITAGVQALYDLVINSMDWGSGFLTVEDATPVAEIARLCGFEDCERVEEYVAKLTQLREQLRFVEHFPRHGEGLFARYGPPVEHDHVWSSIGRCMWPKCETMRGSE